MSPFIFLICFGFKIRQELGTQWARMATLGRSGSHIDSCVSWSLNMFRHKTEMAQQFLFSSSIGLQIFMRIHSPFLKLWYAYRQKEGQSYFQQFFHRDVNESVHETHVLFRMLFLFSLRLSVFEAIQKGHSAYWYKNMGLRLKNWGSDRIKTLTERTFQNYYYVYTIQYTSQSVNFVLSLTVLLKVTTKQQVKPIINTAITQSDLLATRYCVFTIPTM